MPAAYFHEVVARQALGRITKQQALDPVWILGSQGPDPLFFYRVIFPRHNKLVNLAADLIHNQYTNRFLCQLVRRAKDASEVEKGYVLGFISHYATDTTLHPFVYAHSYDKNGKYKSVRHLCLEAKMDTWVWKQEGKRGTPLHYGKHPEKEELANISDLLSESITRVFPNNPVSTKEVFTAFSDAKWICRLLYSPRGIKFFFFWLLEHLLLCPGLITSHIPPAHLRDKKFLNSQGEIWYSPWDKKTRQVSSVPELLEEATEKSVRWMLLAKDYWKDQKPLSMLASSLGDKHYGSGIDWRKTVDL